MKTRYQFRLLSIICVLAMLLSIMPVMSVPAIAVGNTVYVDAVNGHDDTGDGTVGNPYKSICKGVSVTADGDVVLVAAGTYSSAATGESFPLNIEDGITIQGSGAGKTVVAGSGTGIFNVDTDSATMIFTGLTITGAGESGIYSYMSNLVVTDCVFADNYSADYGGGIYAFNDGLAKTVDVSNTIFSGNEANVRGGGIYMDGVTGSSIHGCMFEGNTASQHGGAIYQKYGAAEIYQCVFRNNTGLLGDGAFCIESGAADLYNNLFTGNVCDNYGIVDYYDSSGDFYNNTLAGNTYDDSDGGILYFEDSDCDVYNNIVWGNEGDDIFVDTGSVCAINYNDLQDGARGPNDISTDPLFVNAAAGNYRPQLSSPCLGAGVDDESHPAPDVDLDGITRPAPVAIGAYEYHAPPIFDPMADGKLINIDEGQVITSNPYIIKVFPSSEFGIAYVEFYIDGILIGTVYTPNADGIYECPWDTGTYHSVVRAVAYDTLGQTAEIIRNTTVTLPYTGR